MRNLQQTKLALWMVCIDRAGVRGGAQLVELCDDWRDCVTANGGPVGFEAYAKWTRKYSYRTAYRRLALFRESFPMLGPEGTPEALLGPRLAQLAREAQVEA